MTFCEEVDYLVKAEAQIKGTSIKTAEARIAKRLGVVPSTVQRWRYRKHKDSFKPRLSTPRGVRIEKSVRRSYLRRQKLKAAREISRKPPTLHVVCSPGGGAFSVYMFIRYALAQNEHFNAQVKMTMLCRQEEDGTVEAERWWNNWLSDEDSRQCLKVPDGWAPQFLRKENDHELSVDLRYTKGIFILAGGEQGRLVQAFWHLKGKKGNHQQVVLLTEEDLVKYHNEEFAFQPAFENKNTLLPDRHNLKPQECLAAVEKAHKAKLDELLNSPRDVGPIKPVGQKDSPKNQGTFKVHWEKDIQFFEHEPTRLIVNVRPKFTSVKVRVPFQYHDSRKVRMYVKHYIEDWFPWRKSLRFKLEEEVEGNLDSFFKIRPDARKLFAHNVGRNSSRGKNYNDESILFSHSKESSSKQSEATALVLIAWDWKNIGRSTQLLSQSLETLEKGQNLLLLDFSEGNDENRKAQSPLIIESLQHHDGQPSMYNEDFAGLKTHDVSTARFLESETISTVFLSTIGMNGPSLKNVITSIDSSKNLQLLGESSIPNQSKKLEPLSVHRAFMRGIFPIISIGDRYLNMSNFENPWLIRADQIMYITWLEEKTSKLQKRTYLPYRLMCTVDSSGRVLHVFDFEQKDALEVLLYIALFNLQYNEKGRFFSASPNPIGFETKTMFDQSDAEPIKFPNPGSTQNAEVWFTELKDGAFGHFVGDAKAIHHKPESDAHDQAEEKFTLLASKYNWKTLHGHIRVVMLSLLGGHNGSLANDNPFIFSKQTYLQLKKGHQKVSEKLYSIEVSQFAEYIKSFMRKYQPDITPKSFQEYRGNDEEGHSNFDAELPFHQSESIPKKNQTSLHFFRKNQSGENSHSGFFFDPDTHDFQNAFYFHNKSPKEVAEYFLSSQERNHSIKADAIGKISNITQVYNLIKVLLSPPQKTVSEHVSSKVTVDQSELSEDDNELLMRLVQITTVLGIESPTQEQQNRGYLSKWAHQVFVRLYSTADENIMKKSRTLCAENINREVNTLFQRAVFEARKDGVDPTESLNMFISQLNFFCSEIETKAGKRYERYRELKAKRSSRSSQSDE